MELSSFNAEGIAACAPDVAVAEASHRCSDLKLQSVCFTVAAVVAVAGSVMLIAAAAAALPYSCAAFIILTYAGAFGFLISAAIAWSGPDYFTVCCAVANWKALQLVKSRMVAGEVASVGEEKLRELKGGLDKIIAGDSSVSAVVKHLIAIGDEIELNQKKLLTGSDDKVEVEREIANLKEKYVDRCECRVECEKVGRALLEIRKLIEQKDAKASDVVHALLFARFLWDVRIPDTWMRIKDIASLSGATELLDGALLLFGVVASKANDFEEPGAFDEVLWKQPSSREGYRPI
jgi:hypothetical protein